MPDEKHPKLYEVVPRPGLMVLMQLVVVVVLVVWWLRHCNGWGGGAGAGGGGGAGQRVSTSCTVQLFLAGVFTSLPRRACRHMNSYTRYGGQGSMSLLALCWAKSALT